MRGKLGKMLENLFKPNINLLKLGKITLGCYKEVQGEEQIPTPDHSPSKGKSPWKMGVHWPAQKKVQEPIQKLRRTTRKTGSTPRYGFVALTDELPIEPSSYEEAEKSQEWQNAMKEEIEALKGNQTWELVPKPKDVRPISCKWVYKTKDSL
jgi:hypothetical protein